EGRLNEAAEILAKAPANSQDEAVTFARAAQFYYERRFDEAIVQIQQHTPPEFANDPRIMTYLGYCQKFAGLDDGARATFTRAAAAMKPTPDSTVVIDARNLPCYLAWVYAGLGEKEKALQQARHAITDYHNDALVKPLAEASLAIVEAQTGDIDSAIAALPHLLEVPNGETCSDLQLNPLWDPLRKDPRFQKLCSGALSENCQQCAIVWRGENHQVHVAQATCAYDFCSIRRPARIDELARSIRELHHASAVTIRKINNVEVDEITNYHNVVTATRSISRAQTVLAQIRLPRQTKTSMKTAVLFGAAALWCIPCFAKEQSADERLRAIYTEEWKWRLEQFPGIEGVEKPVPDRLPRVDPATQAMRLRYWQDVVHKLDEVPRAQLSTKEQINYDVYRPEIENFVADQKFRDYEMPANSD